MYFCCITDTMTGELYSFGEFTFDAAHGTLTHAGAPVAASNRGLALLKALLQAGGEIVPKNALMEAAWPNARIEESNLTVQIAALRKSLGSDGEEWIATVPRIGYRFARPAKAAGGTLATTPVLSQSAAADLAIAVLPFTNMSSDPEQEFFADGLAEDLISDLSKVPGLLVIARNSSFAYKGKPADLRTVAKDLGVRYIVEGSVRRAAERVRISAKLIDTVDHSHLWVDRFDRDLADVFALQDEIVGRIVNALADVLPSRAPVSSRRATNVEAYDLFVRGRVLVTQSPDTISTARALLEKATVLDPEFAEAQAWLAMSHHFGWKYWGEEADRHRANALAIAERAVSLDPESADAHWILGYVRTYDFHLADGFVEFNTALRINPNHADAWALLGDLKVFDGRPVEAHRCVEQAFRLNPYPPGFYYWMLGWVHYAGGRYEESVGAVQNESARGTGARRTLAGALAQLGRVDEAREEGRLYLQAMPRFRVSEWAATQPFKNPADRQHFIDGYIKAGLPM